MHDRLVEVTLISKQYPLFVLEQVEDFEKVIYWEVLRFGEKLNVCYVRFKKPVSRRRVARLFPKYQISTLSLSEIENKIKSESEKYIRHDY